MIIGRLGISSVPNTDAMKPVEEKKPNFLESGSVYIPLTILYYVATALIIYGIQIQTPPGSGVSIMTIVNSVLWPLTAVLAGLSGLFGASNGLLVPLITVGPYVVIIILIFLWQRRRAAIREALNSDLCYQHELSERKLALRQQIREISKNTDSEHRTLRQHVKTAASEFEAAQNEFREGVINPFWEAVERVVQSLDCFESGVSRVRENVSEHTQLCRELKDTPSPVDGEIDQASFDRAIELAQQLRSLMREAQKIPAFATVYEQRRTTSAVSIGFTTLSAAIMAMEKRIKDSHDALSTALQSSLYELQSAQITATSHLAEQVDSSLESISGSIEEGNRSREKTHKLLKDHIEDHRKH